MGSRKRRRSSTSSSESEDDEDKRTLFVANLNSKVTEEIFYELFLQAGPIESVRIPKDKKSNQQKTFGFITYKYKCAVPYALHLYDGVKLFGERLVIKARELKDSNNTQNFRNPGKNLNDFRNSSLRYGFRDKIPDMTPKSNVIDQNNDLKNINMNLEGLKQFSPQLIEDIKGSFTNPFKASTSGNVEKHRSDFKHSSRHDSRSDRRDKPYHKSNRNEKYNNYMHRGDKRSEQRKNR